MRHRFKTIKDRRYFFIATKRIGAIALSIKIAPISLIPVKDLISD